MAVQESASSLPSREQLLENGIVHDAEDHLLLHGQADDHACVRKPVDEVHSTVDGIYDPRRDVGQLR